MLFVCSPTHLAWARRHLWLQNIDADDLAGCRGERTYLVAELARAFGADVTVGEALRRMRCTHGCGGRVLVAWIETGPAINARARPRRVPLLGPEATE